MRVGCHLEIVCWGNLPVPYERQDSFGVCFGKSLKE